MSDAPASAPQPPDRAGSPELQGLDPAELLARGLETAGKSGSAGEWLPPTPDEVGCMLPQYRIDGLIGRGGMGAVYKATQLSLDRVVAIKLLPVEIATDLQFVVRFDREARTLARLQNARIVTIYESGRTGEGHLYFAMEYVDGTNLREILRGPGLDPEQALAVVAHAVRLCNTLVADLEIRRQAETLSGGDNVLHQKSNLTEWRRDHLTWPMYFLERDERAERHEKARNTKVFMKDLKIQQWANSSRGMRTIIDMQYSQFREALRQSPPRK